MNTRRSVPPKALASRSFPWTVDVPVPPDGLGQLVNEMDLWCRERGMVFEMHGETVRGAGGERRAVVRFFFKSAGDAEEFRRAWAAAS